MSVPYGSMHPDSKYWWFGLVSRQDLRTIFEEDPNLLLEDMIYSIGWVRDDRGGWRPRLTASPDEKISEWADTPTKPEPPENVRIFSI